MVLTGVFKPISPTLGYCRDWWKHWNIWVGPHNTLHTDIDGLTYLTIQIIPIRPSISMWRVL